MPLYHQRGGAVVCMLRASLMVRKDHTQSFLLRITESWLGFKSDIVHHTVEA